MPSFGNIFHIFSSAAAVSGRIKKIIYKMHMKISPSGSMTNMLSEV